MNYLQTAFSFPGWGVETGPGDLKLLAKVQGFQKYMSLKFLGHVYKNKAVS